MSRLASDLVRDSKLETTFADGATRHAITVSNPLNGLRQASIEETWEKSRLLGRGTFGMVWLERCTVGARRGDLRAVKTIMKQVDGSSPVDYGRELEAIAKFSGRKYVYCFVESYGWFEDETTIYIAMEYLQHGDLSKLMAKAFPEVEVRQILTQLVEGVVFMHDNGYAHRDLKPQNILVRQRRPSWWVKIGDFGICKRLTESTLLLTETGTRNYMAPEIMGIFSPADLRLYDANDSCQYAYSFSVDVWSLGVIAFQLITNRLPFTDLRALSNYVTLGAEFPSHLLIDLPGGVLSQQCHEFIQATMAASPSKRLSAKELALIPWLATQPEVLRESYTISNMGDERAIAATMSTTTSKDITDPSAGWSATISSVASQRVNPFTQVLNKASSSITNQATTQPPTSELGSSKLHPSNSASPSDQSDQDNKRSNRSLPVLSNAKSLAPSPTPSGSEGADLLQQPKGPSEVAGSVPSPSIAPARSAGTHALDSVIGDEEFEFDDIVVNAAAYRRVFAKKVRESDSPTPEFPNDIVATLRLPQTDSAKTSKRKRSFGWLRRRRKEKEKGGIPVVPDSENTIPLMRARQLTPPQDTTAKTVKKPEAEPNQPTDILIKEQEEAQQSEQLPFFKDYYSQDDIHPGDRVSVLWAYQPRAADEFALERGDMLKVVGIWDDGWATGVMLDENMADWDATMVATESAVSGEIKALPLVCICLPKHWKKVIEEDTRSVRST